MVTLGNSNSKSKSRRKLNYNSFYNSSLRNNRFLDFHPENKRVMPIQIPNWLSFSGVGEVASQPRTSLSTPIAPFLTPTTTPSDLQKYYVVEETTNLQLAPQSFEEVLNESEDGEILAIEAITASPLITVEIVVYGLGNSPCVINDYSINDMIGRGRGLTPGEVEILPGGRGKDAIGIPRRYFPYIARYKPDVLSDHLDEAREKYVFVYEPSIPLPYSSIIINVKNTSELGDRVVDSVLIHRRVYESPFAANLAGTPIESADVFGLPESIVNLIPATGTKTTAPTPVNNLSPYIANYMKRQQSLAEAAIAPDIIPSDDW